LNLVIFVTGVMIITLLVTQRTLNEASENRWLETAVVESGQYSGLAINGQPVPQALWLQWVTSGQWTDWMLALRDPASVAEVFDDEGTADGSHASITLLGPQPVTLTIGRADDQWFLLRTDKGLRFLEHRGHNKHLFPPWLLKVLHAGTP
jgi:hypothetical protein